MMKVVVNEVVGYAIACCYVTQIVVCAAVLQTGVRICSGRVLVLGALLIWVELIVVVVVVAMCLCGGV